MQLMQALPLSISERAQANVRQPPPEGRRAGRPRRAPQYDSAFGKGQGDAANGLRRLHSLRIKHIEVLLKARLHSSLVDMKPFLEAVAHHAPLGKDVFAWLSLWSARRWPCATEVIAAAAATSRQFYNPNELAEKLNVTFEERQRLHIWSIGACDITEKARKLKVKAQKKITDRLRAKERRRSQGAKPHAGNEQLQPWLALGVSRRTLYRYQKAAALAA